MMYLQIFKFLIPYLIGGLIVGGAAWKIQGMRLDRAKLNLEQSQSQVLACQDANKANQAVIGTLKKEITTSQSLCSARLKAKENTIKKIQDIDNLKPRVNNEKESNVITGDPILDMLNGMFNDTAASSKN